MLESFLVEFVVCPIIALFVYWLVWGRDENRRR